MSTAAKVEGTQATQPPQTPQSAPAGATTGAVDPGHVPGDPPRRPEQPRVELSWPPCRPLDQLDDPRALEQVTVVFTRTYRSYMEGQIAGFLRAEAERMIRARVAVPFDPAIHRQTFASRVIKK